MTPAETFAANLERLIVEDGRSRWQIATACWPEATPDVALRKLRRALGTAPKMAGPRWPTGDVVESLVRGLRLPSLAPLFQPRGEDEDP